MWYIKPGEGLINCHTLLLIALSDHFCTVLWKHNKHCRSRSYSKKSRHKNNIPKTGNLQWKKKLQKKCSVSHSLLLIMVTIWVKFYETVTKTVVVHIMNSDRWTKMSWKDNPALKHFNGHILLLHTDHEDHFCEKSIKKSIVNVLKFQTLYSILFGLNFAFYVVVS